MALKSYFHFLLIFLRGTLSAQTLVPTQLCVLPQIAHESSGVVCNNTSNVWTHNDSGDIARIFLTDQNAKDRGTFVIDGANNRDWEDIAIADFSDGTYIYMGDIGDNNANNLKSYIYRFKEPTLTNPQKGNYTIAGAEKITYQYPDGPRDAETLMIDPQTKDIYICSKRETKNRIYRLPYPQSTTSIITAEFIEEVNLTYATGGEISPDGQEILIRNYTSIFYWKRQTNESIADALKRAYRTLPYKVEPQGEAVCWAADAAGYYTTSESGNGVFPRLYYYSKK